MLNNSQIDSLDILAYFSFFIGLINYNETMNQSDVQDIVQQAVKDIHSHLDMQDKKIDSIIKIIGDNNEE